MKKIVLLFAITFIGLQYSNAQVVQGTSNITTGSGDLRFGAKAGLNFSTFTGGAYPDVTPQVGAFVGGLAEIPAFMDNFYLQPEIMFSYQGADIGIGKLNLLYIHLPIMAKYHITDEIAVEAGPQIGFGISDNGSDYIDSTTLNPLETNTVHIGFNVGGGYRLNDNFYFQLRFSPGLSKIIDNTKTRNMVVQLGASYFF